MKTIRCAIYTRKSSEEGLEQAFNSLHAQREACAAFIASQKAEGWVILPKAYDDGGISGATMEREALQRLLSDIDAGKVDQIVVYKIDRLTRSLADFARIVDRLDQAQVSFVSVTQSFNTATSMGRLTLNMLLSFAQFEREVTAERIRDKIAASKRKGMWMGGTVPLGYDPDGRTLKINEAEAATVTTLYDLYEASRSIGAVEVKAEALGLCTRARAPDAPKGPGGRPFARGHIHQILTNPLYAGRIRHRTEVHPGLHPPIIAPTRWERIQLLLQEDAARSRAPGLPGRALRSPLLGKLFDETGDRLTPSHAKSRKGVKLRYYISHRLIAKAGRTGTSGWRLAAPVLEPSIAAAIKSHLAHPGLAPAMLPDAGADEITRCSEGLQLLVASSIDAAILPLVARVDITPGVMAIRLKPEVLATRLAVKVDRLNEASLRLESPFTTRKRGVETRIVLGDSAPTVDQVLLANIARANALFIQLRAGIAFDEIARKAGTSIRRVQQLLPLAFLAPDIVAAVVAGRQPLGLTSEWLKFNPMPADWRKQREAIAGL